MPVPYAVPVRNLLLSQMDLRNVLGQALGFRRDDALLFT